MKITRVLAGERYTAPDEGLGYLSVVADEDGFEVEQDGHVFWVSDARLDGAVEARNRAVKQNGVDSEPVVEALEGVLARYDVPGAVVEQTDRCGRCRRPGSVGPCSFDCGTCFGCKKSLADGEVRLVTTLDRVYCMDCGTRA
jgi:hypothetical protein